MHDPADHAAAAGIGAGRARPVIDAEGVLEIAERTILMAIIAQGRAARRDGLGEHIADRGDKAGNLRLSERAGRSFRRDPGAVQRLADIDIAKAGDDPLIEQRRLYRHAPAPEPAGEEPRIEMVAKRLHAKPGKGGVLPKRPGRLQQHEAEAAGIVEDEPARIIEREDHMIMCAKPRHIMVETPRRLASRCMLDEEPAAHPQMDDQRLAGGKRQQEVFRPPVRRPDHRTGEALGKADGKRKTQVRAVERCALDAPALEMGRKTTTDGLDFRQFWQDRLPVKAVGEPA